MRGSISHWEDRRMGEWEVRSPGSGLNIEYLIYHIYILGVNKPQPLWRGTANLRESRLFFPRSVEDMGVCIPRCGVKEMRK